jgi:integrase/recombinase XerD
MEALFCEDVSNKNHIIERRKIMGELGRKMKMDMELKNLSLRTIQTYLSWMKSFTLHYGRSPEKLGDDDIRNYLYFLLKEKGVAQASINQAYSALKFFYQTTLGRSWNEEKIPRSKVPKKLPVVLSKEEVRDIFSSTSNLKHLAIFMTIYSGGLRISEATHLKPEDIDSKRMSIKVRGKGDKERYTLLGEKTLDILRTYWQVHRPLEWLFHSKVPGQPISTSSVQRSFKDSLHKSGVKKKASVHTLRHSFATHLLESGVDIIYIQRLLGHTSTKTTSIYLHVTRKGVARIKSPIDLLEDTDKPMPEKDR